MAADSRAGTGASARPGSGPGIAPRRRYVLGVRGSRLVLGERTLVMGVVNVTPDSFSDGGLHASPEAAVEHALKLFADGADLVDVGGESTRPGARRVDAGEQRRRVVPVVERVRRQASGLVSVDTTAAEVAEAALDAGADLVNDVSGLRFDADMAPLVARRGVPAVLMHLRGGFVDMHSRHRYADVAGEVRAELARGLERARMLDVPREQLLVDPGLGFSKNAEQSLKLLGRLPELAVLDRPLLVGPSRKSFIGHVLDLPVEQRLTGTVAAVAACALLGAHVVRVHDVVEAVQAVRLIDALRAAARVDEVVAC